MDSMRLARWESKEVRAGVSMEIQQHGRSRRVNDYPFTGRTG